METFRSLLYKDNNISIEKLRLIAEQSERCDLPNSEPSYNDEHPDESLLNKQLAENVDTIDRIIRTALAHIDAKHFAESINIVDWNCIQGVSTVSIKDYISVNFPDTPIKAVKLISLHAASLERAEAIVKAACGIDEVRCVNKNPNNVISDNLRFAGGTILHIFNDMPGVDDIDFKAIASRLATNANCTNIVIGYNHCDINADRRITALINYMGDALREVKLLRDNMGEKSIFTFVIDAKSAESLKTELPPPTMMSAAYMLDCVADNPRATQQMSRWVNFEVHSPFYIAAEASDTPHPLLAVVANIIVRSLPTLASPGIEQTLSVFFGLTHRTSHHHRINYESNMEKAIGRELQQSLTRGPGSNIAINQMAFTPIEVARIHKVVIEAMLTGRLDVNAQYWNILVIERDVPCAAIAIRDLEELFANLAEMTTEYRHMTLPQIRLDIISTEQYASSPLHLGYAPTTSIQRQHQRRKYDIVIETSIGKCDPKTFSLPKLTAKNGCIFSLFSTKSRTQPIKALYTGSHIIYNDIMARTANVEYFLSLLFRHGRSDIDTMTSVLNRALHGKPVLACTNDEALSTIIYSVAAMLQPGMTVVASASEQTAQVQCRNLKSVFIDCCAMTQNMTPKAFDAEWLRVDGSQCQVVSIASSLLFDPETNRKLASLHGRCIYCTMFVLYEADAVSMWSDRFEPMHATSPAEAEKCLAAKSLPPAMMAVAPIIPSDVTVDIISAISPDTSPAKAIKLAIHVAPYDMCQVQYTVEKVPTQPVPIDNFDAIQQARLSFLGTYLPRLPLLLRSLQSTNSLKRILEGTKLRTRRDCKASTTPIPDNYLEKKDEYEHGGIIFTHRNNNNEVEKAIKATGAEAISCFTSEYNDNNDPVTRLAAFVNDKYPLLVAPANSNLCIEKHNIRFAINLGCPDSIEQLISTAELCGLDGKMALVSILLPQFDFCHINADSTPNLPAALNPMEGHWTPTEQLLSVCDECGIDPSSIDIDKFTPTADLLRINCAIDNDIFISHLCNYCKEKQNCHMSGDENLPHQWVTECRFDQFKAANNIDPTMTSVESLAQGYNTAMPAIDRWKHNIVMQRKLTRELLGEIQITYDGVQYNGLAELLNVAKSTVNLSLSTEIAHSLDEMPIATGTLYLFTILGIIDDYKIDKAADTIQLSITGKPDGSYCRRLLQLLMRYLPQHQAEDLASGACNNTEQSEAENAVYALMQFIEEKHYTVQRRTRIDIEDLCITATHLGNDIENTNEYIKDYLHSYYHSPFMQQVGAETRGGKKSSFEILAQYAQMLGSMADDALGVMQFHGAVRRLLRSSMHNGMLHLLDALCMKLLKYDTIPLLAGRISTARHNGYTLMRRQYGDQFNTNWQQVKPLLKLSDTGEDDSLDAEELGMELDIHIEWLNNFINKYCNGK